MVLVIYNFVFLLSLVIWVGSIVFFSFCAAPSVFKMLAREKAGEVIGDIFPKYWLVGYACGVVGTLSLVFIPIAGGRISPGRFILYLIMTVLGFYSGLVVGRQARIVKNDIRSVPEGEEKERLRSSFRKIHAKSTILNMVILAFGFLVIYLTAVTL